MQGRGFNSFASNMIKLSVSETKWSSLLARTRALILYISISIFDFGPENLPGLSRNRPQIFKTWYQGIFINALMALANMFFKRIQSFEFVLRKMGSVTVVKLKIKSG